MFRRKRDGQGGSAHHLEHLHPGDAAGEVVEESFTGPYDSGDVPDEHLPRLDLGALMVPLLEGVQIGFSRDEASGEVLSAVLTDNRSAFELSVFAAPKSGGIWGEVRDEILASLREAGGTPHTVDGPYGIEIAMQLPTDNPRVTAPGRLIGVDGPRWFLRAVITGEAAVDPAASLLLDTAMRGVVVVRGDTAMPLRDPLPLRLPRELVEAADGVAVAPGVPAPGVHITETR